MLRVLHCIYDDPDNPWVGGGGAMRVREIYSRLGDAVNATVATGGFPGATNVTQDGVRYLRLGARRPYPWSRLTYGAAATRLLARGQFDVGLFDYSVYTPIRLPRTGPVGLVVHMLHGPTAGGRWGGLGAALLTRAEHAGLRSARWISTTSRWMVGELAPLVAPGTRIVPVGSGISPEFANVHRAEGDYLLYYGRLDLYQKGLDVLLDAFQRILAGQPALRLVIAGRGKDAERVRDMVVRRGVGGAVDLRVGASREEVLALMAGALALVMPSRLEGLPMVPAEAMAAGVPVIASAVGALAEVVEAPECGLLVPPGDRVALEQAMHRLVVDAPLRRSMSEAARRSAERYSWDRVAASHLEFLKSIRDGEFSPQLEPGSA
jgi:glycosyltransferase involved in cell wall biosynthesis